MKTRVNPRQEIRKHRRGWERDDELAIEAASSPAGSSRAGRDGGIAVVTRPHLGHTLASGLGPT